MKEKVSFGISHLANEWKKEEEENWDVKNLLLCFVFFSLALSSLSHLNSIQKCTLIHNSPAGEWAQWVCLFVYNRNVSAHQPILLPLIPFILHTRFRLNRHSTIASANSYGVLILIHECMHVAVAYSGNATLGAKYVTRSHDLNKCSSYLCHCCWNTSQYLFRQDRAKK